MGRNCAECGNVCGPQDFSRKEYAKGDGYSRCSECASGTVYVCGECGRMFGNQHNLDVHLQRVHRTPRNVRRCCPVCGEEQRLMRSGGSGLREVDCGYYCRSCRGVSSARNQMYRLASSQAAAAIRPYNMMVSAATVPMIFSRGTAAGSFLHRQHQPHTTTTPAMPEFPYQCNFCAKQYRNLGALMQHQDKKHSNVMRMVGH